MLCRAVGAPTPNITWIYNGKSIDSTCDHIVRNYNNVALMIAFVLYP